MPVLNPKAKQVSPTKTIVLSFLLVILVGTALLILPLSAKDGSFTPPLDALFTAVSATCVTGLVVYDTYTHWSVFGQAVILLMIQIGGLGLVTFASFFNFAVRKKMNLRSMQLASESVSTGGFNDIKALIKSVVKIALVIEGIGTLLLLPVFVPEQGAYGVFMAFFFGISAFCNAGFDLTGYRGEYTSLIPYADNPLVVLTITSLILCGGLGFVVWYELFRYRKLKKLSLHTKVILLGTAVLLILGTLLLLGMEWDNPQTLGEGNLLQKLSRAYFQSVSFRTAGFNTIPMNEMYPHTKLFGSLLMFIGVAPASTGGGIKITTFAVVLMTVVSVVRNRSDTQIMRHRIEKEVVYKSLAILVLSGVLVMVTTCVLVYSNDPNIAGVDAFFESVSAFATVGMSVGPTLESNPLSRLFLIFTMFVGRVGPVSLMLSLTLGKDSDCKSQVIPDGKVIVG